MVLFAVVAIFLTKRAPFGRWVYAIGGNERAAELAGVQVNKVKRRVYMISGACAAMAGLIIASELTSAAPQAGETFELNAIAAVVIGGASLSGGRGAVRGALIGAFVIGFLADGLVIVGVSTFWQIVIKGAVIVLAVILDQSQQRIQRRGAAAAAAAQVAESTTRGPPRRPDTAARTYINAPHRGGEPHADPRQADPACPDGPRRNAGPGRRRLRRRRRGRRARRPPPAEAARPAA